MQQAGRDFSPYAFDVGEPSNVCNTITTIKSIPPGIDVLINNADIVLRDPFNITTSILGSTIDPANANGIKSSDNAALSNCYIATDCVFSANPITGATSYSGAAADLFTAPAEGDFTIKDNSFAGKSTTGDPRWR